MDLLQKLTLYDLLGYALPGTILILGVGWEEISAILLTGEGGSWIILILIGYVAGIIVSELAAWILGRLEVEIPMEEVCVQNKISLEQLSQVVFKAGLTAEVETMDYPKVSKYLFQIYADIQSDTRYVRIHNYASAALLYKNLTVVFALCLIIRGGQLDWKMIAAGIGIVILLAKRWRRFDGKKRGYSLAWFIRKYTASSSKTTEDIK